MNTEFERAFGWSATALVGRPLTSIIPERFRDAHNLGFSRFLATGRAHILARPVQLAVLTGDGREVPAEHVITATRESRRWAFGATIRPLQLGGADDVHEPTSEASLDDTRATLAKVELALSLVRDGLIWIDRAGRIVWCNSVFDRLLATEHIRLVGTRLIDRLPLRRDGRAVAEDEHPAHRVLSGVSELSETYETTLGGSEWIVEVYARASPGEDDIAAVLVIQDVTERTHAQEKLRALNLQLEATNVELEAFAYSVSHDLRAPLRAVDGFSQAVLEDHGAILSQGAKNYLERVRAAAQRMARLIDGLLLLSSVSRGELNRDAVDLSALARAVAADVGAAAQESRVALIVADGMTVQGDERLLRQVLENLIGNAWKFTGKTPDPRVEVGSLTQDGNEVFYVRDNGAGFDPRLADKLFGAFQRLHSSHEFPGTGIGLAIVRRIIHRHGGRVWAQGAAGEGATFFFTLPPQLTTE